MGSFSANVFTSLPIIGSVFGKGFRPPQWDKPQLTSITARLPTQINNDTITTEQETHTIRSDGGGVIEGGSNVDNPTIRQTITPSQLIKFQETTYFFDAILSVDHFQELRTTFHPVQNGAPIIDHAFLLPARVVLEIGMSDLMDTYKQGMFDNYTTKSVSAYQTLLYLQGLRVPLTVNTRLNNYKNMVIESVRSRDDQTTFHGLRALVSFVEIIQGTVILTPPSARENASSTTNIGTVSGEPVPPELIPLIPAH